MVCLSFPCTPYSLLVSAPSEGNVPPARWIQAWLAALPVLYVISPLSLFGLPQLRRLPSTVWWILGFYALSQQLPALFSPDPLMASGLAMLRTLLILGLIGLGACLRQAGHLRWLGLGLAITYVTAVAFTWLSGTELFEQRLNHPYMTPITLGLAGAFGVWLALFTAGRLLWRLPLGLLAVGVLLLAGSRGPLAAALIGAVAGFLVRRGRRVALSVLVGMAFLAAGVYAGQQLELGAITRLGSADTTGRDIVWYNTLSVIRSEPLGGVGSYRLGTRLAPPGGSCELFSAVDGEVLACPDWVKALGNPWLIAHNVSLQQLAETGPLGLLGLFVLLGAVLTGAAQQRDPLGVAVITGLLIATANDNTLLVPSPFFAEVFWLTAGTQMQRLQGIGARYGLLTSGLMLGLSFPLLASVIPAPASPPMSLRMLHAPTIVRGPRDYTVFMQFNAPPGQYRAVLQGCLGSCSTIAVTTFTTRDGMSPVLRLGGDLRAVDVQNVEVLVYPGAAGARIQPTARRAWSVKVQP